MKDWLTIKQHSGYGENSCSASANAENDSVYEKACHLVNKFVCIQTSKAMLQTAQSNCLIRFGLKRMSTVVGLG